MSDIVFTLMEKQLEEICRLPARTNNPYVMTEDGRTAGEDMNINQAALEAMNSAHSAISPEAYEPIEDLYDLAGDPDYVIEQFKFVRDVLMELPDEVLTALCKRKGWRLLKGVASTKSI
jgi:hypothetical protein